MKKFTAILVMTAMLCSFVSCGPETADEIPEESSVISIAEEETTTEETTESETEEETSDESSESETEEPEQEETTEPSEKLSADGSYEEAIEMLLECMNNRDFEGMMSLSFPDKYHDVMLVMAEMSGASLDDLMGEFEGESQEDIIRLVEIISAEPMPEEDMEMIYEMYGMFQPISDYIEQTGKDNIDYEKFEEVMSAIDESSELKPYFEVKDGLTVNCMFESEYEDGEKYTYEQELIMYYIDGEGWKTDLSMMGYVKKSKQASANSNVKTLINASNASLCDLDEYGIAPTETCIISSDSTKNYNVSEDFLSEFESILESFYPDYKDYDYFIVIRDGVAVYVAGVDPENPELVGTYPAEQLYSADGEYIYKDETYTYDELYNMCLDEIK